MKVNSDEKIVPEPIKENSSFKKRTSNNKYISSKILTPGSAGIRRTPNYSNKNKGRSNDREVENKNDDHETMKLLSMPLNEHSSMAGPQNFLDRGNFTNQNL